MSNPSKAKGTRFESAVCDYLPAMLILLIMLIISWWCDRHHF